MKKDTHEKIRFLRNYYEVTRRKGHTTLMKEGTKNYKDPFFIVAPGMNYNGIMECKPDQIISWNRLEKLQGSDKPLAFDNSIMYTMFNEINEYIEDLKTENERLKRTLKAYIGS